MTGDQQALRWCERCGEPAEVVIGARWYCRWHATPPDLERSRAAHPSVIRQ